MSQKLTLYPYQQLASDLLIGAINSCGAALDASDTGVGKTFTALGVADGLDTDPFIICPKSIQTAWREACESLAIRPIDVVNIEKIKAGNTPYMSRPSKKKFIWTLPRGTLIIYDECQGASGYKTANSKVLALTRGYGYKVLGLSATVAESPLQLKALGYLLKLHKYTDHYSWCLRYGCYKNAWGGLEFVRGAQRVKYLKELNKQIFPDKGVRVRIKDLDSFPDNKIIAQAYDLSKRDTDEINSIFDEMEDNLKNPEYSGSALTEMLRARQATELYKVPLLAEMTTELLEEGKHVVIFVSFRETLSRLASQFPDASVLLGGQKIEERDAEIAKFQRNQSNVCIAMIQAGGVGVSLHDTTGDAPRVSLITPTYSARELKQALGRIHRATGKTKCLQKIIYAAGTVEERACKAVKRKLDNISLLNDGDLMEGLDI